MGSIIMLGVPHRRRLRTRSQSPPLAPLFKVGVIKHVPVKRLGRCCTCLAIYPRGTEKQRGAMISAFVSVIPDVLWSSDWRLPTKYSITVVNHHDAAASIRKTDTFEFGSPESNPPNDHGWHDIVKWESPPAMRRQGLSKVTTPSVCIQ
eukprot:12431475-Karenia_brevis.AAC.4